MKGDEFNWTKNAIDARAFRSSDRNSVNENEKKKKCFSINELKVVMQHFHAIDDDHHRFFVSLTFATAEPFTHSNCRTEEYEYE